MKHGMKHAPREKRRKSGRFREKQPIRYRFATWSKVLKRTFIFAAALVVFGTTYAMVLPAITISVPNCGIEEHTHTDGCYRIERKLICENTEEDHVHTDECYVEQKTLMCEKEQHTHTDECYEKPKEEETKGNEKKNLLGSSSPGDSVSLDTMDFSAYKNFEEYLKTTGGRIEGLLYDSGNNLVDNIYEASGQGYTYILKLYSPYIMPDSYYYFLPKGMDVDFASKTGEISNGTSVIGTYKIADDSTFVLFTFDENVTHYQNITGQITLSVSFEERINASVSKTGWLIASDGAFDGYFHFKISAKIPADREGLAEKEWKFLDRSEITDQWYQDFGDPENAANTHVYISYDQISNYELKNIKEVYNDTSVKMAYYTDDATKELYLVNRCTCEDSKLCVNSEDGHCKSDLLKSYPGWCTCWGLDENATVDIVYKNAVNGADGTYILKDQNGLQKSGTLTYENRVTLTGSSRNSSGKLVTETHKATAAVEYTHLMDKQETVHATQEGGYQSSFRITINPQKADFSKMDKNGDGVYDRRIVITDTMSSLKYITGSMVISAEDAEGNVYELIPGNDFEVETTQTDKGTTLEISLTKLGPYTYYIDYSAQVFKDSSETTVEISNSVLFSLYEDDGGQQGEGGNPEYSYSRRFAYDEQWDYLKYEVNVLKVDYEDNTVYLPGAVFGLYSADNTLIAERTTDENGKCRFATDVLEGLIFNTDTMYYIKEISPPQNYDLNTVCYWFYFSDERDTIQEQRMERKYPGISITYVAPKREQEYVLDMEVTNEKSFILPETGGDGAPWRFAAGTILLLISAGCIIVRLKLRKRE